MALIDALGRAFGRPVDLVDLRGVGEPPLGAILGEGRRIVGDSTAWGDLLSRHLVNQADFVPLQNMILRRRLQSWTRP